MVISVTDNLVRNAYIQTRKEKLHLNKNPLSLEIIHDKTLKNPQHSDTPIVNPPSSDNIDGLRSTFEISKSPYMSVFI